MCLLFSVYMTSNVSDVQIDGFRDDFSEPARSYTCTLLNILYNVVALQTCCGRLLPLSAHLKHVPIWSDGVYIYKNNNNFYYYFFFNPNEKY